MIDGTIFYSIFKFITLKKINIPKSQITNPHSSIPKMKHLLSFFKWLIIIVLIAMAGLYFTGNQFLLKGIWAVYLHGHKTASIDDARFFDVGEIATQKTIPWQTSANYNEVSLSDTLLRVLEKNESVAFLIAQNNKLVYEQYWDDYSDSSRSNSFSMAKSITTMLVQCAIQDGFIKSWDQKVVDFIPELKGEYAEELTLRNLSTMTAGLNFNEHYTNPFDITARTYYGPNIWQLMVDEVGATQKPGNYEYQSGATQWLGMVVIKATGQPLSSYASEKLWKPLGAKHPATWHLDSKNGTELSFCCFNSNARDFARFGQLLLQKGNFNGTQILDSNFVEIATSPYAVPYYGHGFWIIDDYNTHIYAMRGILGQYVIVIPKHKLVVVRLGHKRDEKVGVHNKEFLVIVEEMLKQFN